MADDHQTETTSPVSPACNPYGQLIRLDGPHYGGGMSTLLVPQVMSPPKELSLVAFQGDFCHAFLFTNFVWKAYGSPWLEQAAEGKLGDLSHDATRALAQTHFGRSNHRQEIEVQGVMLYGQCLIRLAEELGTGMVLGGSSGGEALLVPMLVLMIFAVGGDASVR
jgi:hypothetical protein